MSAIKGSIVRIGKGNDVWQIIHVTPNGTTAILVAMSRKIGGGYERANYMPGRAMRRVIDVARLVEITA